MSISKSPEKSIELVTRLKIKRDKALQNSKISDRESTNANRRAKQAFFNSVNSIMHNHEISAKKKFSILLKLTKNQKFSNIPPLLKDGNVVTDPQSKSNIFNDLFSSKATVNCTDDPVPQLPPKNHIVQG